VKNFALLKIFGNYFVMNSIFEKIMLKLGKTNTHVLRLVGGGSQWNNSLGPKVDF
jgi:hypothetical protein